MTFARSNNLLCMIYFKSALSVFKDIRVVPPHSLSTSTSLLLHTNNNSYMKNKRINDRTITVRTGNTFTVG